MRRSYPFVGVVALACAVACGDSKPAMRQQCAALHASFTMDKSVDTKLYPWFVISTSNEGAAKQAQSLRDRTAAWRSAGGQGPLKDDADKLAAAIDKMIALLEVSDRSQEQQAALRDAKDEAAAAWQVVVNRCFEEAQFAPGDRL